ncbi:MAG: rRNA maturation RNase YbeY [Candidatus Shapirobacteria bacterium]|nr:rRNA maturation RNase YbeY [Candidatus Shapirobacteria bacterium]
MNSVLIKSAKEFGLSEEKILAWGEKYLLKNGLDNCELSIIFVKPEKILSFNRKYRNLDEATSVLTFFQGQAYPFDKRITPEKTLILGDIVICPEQAEQKNLTIEFLINHGIKNLLSEISTAKSF